MSTDTETREEEAMTDETPPQDGGAADLNGIAPERALEILREMLLYRRFEEKAEEAYAIGKIGGFCHLHIGQEGAAAGSILPLRGDDYVISAYREHTQALDRCTSSMSSIDSWGVTGSWVLRSPWRQGSGGPSGTARVTRWWCASWATRR